MFQTVSLNEKGHLITEMPVKIVRKDPSGGKGAQKGSGGDKGAQKESSGDKDGQKNTDCINDFAWAFCYVIAPMLKTWNQFTFVNTLEICWEKVYEERQVKGTLENAASRHK